MDAMDHALLLMQQIEMLAGGDSNSMVYVKQSELDELKDSKKEVLSYYNNLSNSYHPGITVDGKSGQDWYSLKATEGRTLIFTDESTIRDPEVFDNDFIYNIQRGIFLIGQIMVF